MSREGFLLSGAWGLGNTGDEAILRAMTEKIHTLAPEVPLRVLSMGPGENIPGVEFVPARRPMAVLRAMTRSRVLLSGGGTLLQDLTSRRSLWYYLAVMVLARMLGCRVMVFAAGIGPLRHRSSRVLTKLVLGAAAQEICLRDELSLRQLEEMGLKGRGRLTADAALSQASAWDLTRKTDENMAKIAVFCLRFWPEMEQKQAEIARAAELIRARLGLEPVLLPLGPGDERVVLPGVRALPKPADPAQAEQILRSAGLIVSMRLHGLVLGGDTPAVGISCDPKIAGFCAGRECPWVSWEGMTAEEVAEKAVFDRTFREKVPSKLLDMAEDNFKTALKLHKK